MAGFFDGNKKNKKCPNCKSNVTFGYFSKATGKSLNRHKCMNCGQRW